MPTPIPPEWKLPGRLKVHPEDFIVEEIPAYEPCGQGEHLFLWIEKRDASADFLLGHLSRTLRLRRDDIGMAGMKDRRGITRQWVSLPPKSSTAEAGGLKLEDLNGDSIRVLRAVRHTNKLKTGHLRGNRFDILARIDFSAPESEPFEMEERARRIEAVVVEKGIPNRFGEQRFGIDRETLELGRTLLQGERMPKQVPYKRRRFLMRLALSAVQSSLFNQVLDRRIQQGTLHRVLPGEVMQVRQSGGLFVVQDVASEQARFERREILPTGPLFGPKMKQPGETVRELEQSVLEESGLTEEAFLRFRKLTPGGRRPLLLWPEDWSLHLEPEGIRFRFSLPSGAYATVVLGEFLRADED